MDGDNVALASRKDARDAVGAARKAQPKWAGATAYNRGQILYRAAEMLEGRRAEFVALGVSEAEVDAAIDRLVWYAGWSDKIAQVVGAANPVAGPYFNLSAPEPTGVVGVVAPASLLGLVSVIAPAIVTGNTVVVLGARPADRGDPGRGARHLRPARRGGEHPHRATRPRPRPGWPRTTTSTPSTSPASTIRSSPPSWNAPPPATSSGCCGRRPAGPTSRPTRGCTR